MDFTKISWQELEKDCISLSQKLKDKQIDEILSISRGGMVVARILSDLLALPICHMTITTYDHMQQLKEPMITEFPIKSLTNKTVLLVDEVSDTGKTFHKALEHLHSLSLQQIYTVSPYIKPHTTYTPDFWQTSIDAWIVFPYDLRETKESLTKLFGSEKQAVEKMRELGFADWEIEY